MNLHQNLEQTLRDALHDDRLALPVPADTLEQVRRKRRNRQRGIVAGAACAAAALAMTGIALVPGGGARSSVVPGQVQTTPTPLPGSTPGYYIRTARSWFMTKAQSDAFFTGYQQPSPKPGDSVPSPQASGPLTDRLVQELEAAGVPGAADLKRDEADSGQRGSLSLEGQLPDGSSLGIYRYSLLFPINLDGIGQNGSSKYVTIEDVPGTDGAALIVPPNMPGSGSGSSVMVVTPAGVQTGWSSATVPLAQLKTWAYAAARWAADHPG